MTALVWHEAGTRQYQNGLDRGVLYLADGNVVPWNGLTSVNEKNNRSVDEIYYDGMKTSQLVKIGDYEATLRAITYPDEFASVQGLAELGPGMFVGEQTPASFGLSYRTLVGNELEGDSFGYRIHIVYNLMALPSDTSYSTITADPEMLEFEWALSTVPEEIDGFRPSAHVIFDSWKMDPYQLTDLEQRLYGSSTTQPYLPPIEELVEYMADWARFWVRINFDEDGNPDGTWDGVEGLPGVFIFDTAEPTVKELRNVNTTTIDANTFEITDTGPIVPEY